MLDRRARSGYCVPAGRFRAGGRPPGPPRPRPAPCDVPALFRLRRRKHRDARAPHRQTLDGRVPQQVDLAVGIHDRVDDLGRLVGRHVEHRRRDQRDLDAVVVPQRLLGRRELCVGGGVHDRLDPDEMRVGGGAIVQVGFFSWVDLVLASFVVILIASQILAATGSLSQTVPENIDTRTMVVSVLIWWGLILGPILVSLRFRGFKLGSVFGVDRMPVGRSVLLGVSLLVSALPMVFAVDYLASVLLKVNPSTDAQEVIRIFENSSTGAQRIPIILLAVVIAPVAEELAFRGYLYGVIKRYFGAVPALVLSGILFALIHLNLPSFFPLLVLASVFALAYELSGSLLVPMTMHALFNALSLILVLVEQK